MLQATIMTTPCFLLISYGNGLAYEIKDRVGAGNSLFIQGDDASEFREELEAFEAANPDMHSEDVLREMKARWRP